MAEFAVSEAASRTTIVVGIAELAVSRDPGSVLITHSLGSCIGVSVWDPVVRVAGLLHYMLPDSRISTVRAKANAAMFCDTGVPALFEAAVELGAAEQRVIVKVAGGSQLLEEGGAFSIGRRNYLAIRKIFSDNGIQIDGESVGGSISRTMRIDAATGVVTVKMHEGEVAL